MKAKDKKDWWKVLAVVFGAIVVFHIGWNLGSLYSAEDETYCIWKLTTTLDSVYPDGIFWEDSATNSYIENMLYERILEDGKIKSIESKCYILGELNKDGTPVEVGR